MNGFNTIIKINLKLLLRNKGYLAFLFILPVISLVMLNLNQTETMFSQQNINTIYELKSESEQVLNMANKQLSVKVIDCNNSMFSGYILKELLKTGAYRIYRFKEKPIDLNRAREIALDSANTGSIGAVLYIPANFDQEILEERNSNIIMFKATKDQRIKLLENNLNTFQKSLYRYGEITGYQKYKMEALLESSINKELKKNVVSIEVGDELNLTSQKKSKSSSISYSLSFLTIGFLFSGVFIAATVIDERKNRVYNRFLLSTASLINYGSSKVLMVLASAIMQTGILALGIKLFVKADYGISFGSYLFLVFCLGIIFNLYSVVIGIITNNVLTSNYIAFITWTFSCLLAGLYFPLDGASKWWVKASQLMPQRWVVKSAEMLMVGKSGVYTTFLLVVGSYLIVIMSVGLIGIRIRRKE